MSINKEQIRAALDQSLTFRDLSGDDLEKLIDRFEIREVPVGGQIINQGDKGEELFIVLRGQLEIVLHHPGTDISKTVRVIGPGEMVGEIAVLIDTRRSASVRALIPSEVAVISKETFHLLLKEIPSITFSVCQALGRAAAASFRLEVAVPFAKISQFKDPGRYRSILPEKVIVACRAVPVARIGMQVTIAMVDAYDEDTRRFLTKVINPLAPEFVAVSEEEFDILVRKENHLSQISMSITGEAPDVRLVAIDSQSIPFEDSTVDRFFVTVFQKAFMSGATDIHLEPKPGKFQARIRIDGNLAELPEHLSGEEMRRAISRIKVMSELDITEHRLPQDGSFTLAFDEQVIDVRVSTLSVRYGEKIALRLIPSESKTHLGIGQFVENRVAATTIRDLFHQPSGLLLVTGPTGGGKTTTIYAGLTSIWDISPILNIVTIEDPIERFLSFANQTQIDETIGRTFPTVLRSVLRQDPDVILVGEIRDRASASIALEAANTGHLVISSVHSHFAHQAISRLQSLDIPPYLIATALRGIISQRLVRKNCANCARSVREGELDASITLLRSLGILRGGSAEGLQVGNGCDACAGTGERHRTALYEILQISEELRSKLYTGQQITVPELNQHPDYYFSMADYARFLLERGSISPKAALRAFPQTSGIMTGRV